MNDGVFLTARASRDVTRGFVEKNLSHSAAVVDVLVRADHGGDTGAARAAEAGLAALRRLEQRPQHLRARGRHAGTAARVSGRRAASSGVGDENSDDARGARRTWAC